MNQVNENEMRRQFILSEQSPDGFWFIEVPIGIKQEDINNYKQIDAVCFPLMAHRLPDEFPECDDFLSLIDTDLNPNVSRAELFRRLLDQRDFSNELAVVYEFKTRGQSLYKGVGQLIIYEDWLEKEWDVRVNQKILISTERDKVIYQSLISAGIDVKNYST